MLKLFDINKENSNVRGIAFADDAVFYVSEITVAKAEGQLQNIIDKIAKYYKQWNLRINPSKCETIVFRRPQNELNRYRRSKIKKLEINIKHPVTSEAIQVKEKKIVKYLGLNIDHLVRLNKHVKIQMEKAQRAKYANARLFKSKFIPSKAKIICYQLLIRAILGYAGQMWWNINASLAEKLRKEERSMLRKCLNMYRRPESKYKKFYSNKELYDAAGIERIDLFLIKITRNYFQRCKESNNPVIKSVCSIKEKETVDQLESGYFPPEAFTLIDRRGWIQDERNVPSLYHVKRTSATKKINNEIVKEIERKNYIYSQALGDYDAENMDRVLKKYWWLDKEKL